MTTMCSIRSSPGELVRVAVHPTNPATAIVATMAKPRIQRRVKDFSQPRLASPEFDLGTHGAGAFMSRAASNGVPCFARGDPFDLHPIVRHMIVGPERNTGVLVRLAFELTLVFAQLPRREGRAGRKRNLGNH